MAQPFDFYGPLSQIGRQFADSWNQGVQRQTLADLGRVAATDPLAASQQAFALGNTGLGLGLMELAETKRTRDLERAAATSARDTYFGANGAASPAGPGMPNGSGARVSPALQPPPLDSAAPDPFPVAANVPLPPPRPAIWDAGNPVGPLPAGLAVQTDPPPSQMDEPDKAYPLRTALNIRATQAAFGGARPPSIPPDAVNLPAPPAAPAAPAASALTVEAADLPARGAIQTAGFAIPGTGEVVPEKYREPITRLMRITLTPNLPAAQATRYQRELDDLRTVARQEAAEGRKAAAEEEPKRFDREGKLRNEFAKRVAPFTEVHDAYGRVVAATEQRQANPDGVSPASDIGLIFGYMKMLDPGSVVREGEFATAQNSGGIPDRVRNAYNKALSGEFLSPEQRQDFVSTADRLYGQARKRAEQESNRFTQLSRSAKVAPENVVDLPPAIRAPTIGGTRTREGGVVPGMVRTVPPGGEAQSGVPNLRPGEARQVAPGVTIRRID